jgi:hypothetical protein
LTFDLANHALYELVSERTSFEENLPSKEQEGFRQSLSLLLDAGIKELYEIQDASISEGMGWAWAMQQRKVMHEGSLDLINPQLRA